MNGFLVAVCIGVALSPACKFPDLPPIETDAPGDSSGTADASGPSAMITSGPDNSSITGPRVSFEFVTQGGSPLCRFDDGPLLPCTSPISINLSEGIHSFLVQVMGPSGSVASDTRLWNVDCVAPEGDASTFGLFHMDEGAGDLLLNARPFQAAPPSRDGNLGDGSTMYRPSRITPGRFGTGGLRFAGHALNETDRIVMSTLLDPPTSEVVSL